MRVAGIAASVVIVGCSSDLVPPEDAYSAEPTPHETTSDAPGSVEAYVARQRDLSRRDLAELPVLESQLLAFAKLGLGNCGGEGEPGAFHILSFGAAPSTACGSGWFAGTCSAAYDNCVAGAHGVTCDLSYLLRMEVMARIVESSSTGVPIPTAAMQRIAGVASSAARFEPWVRQREALEAIIRDYVRPSSSTVEANVARLLADAAFSGALAAHELSHLEQYQCGLGSTDPRHTHTRELLETVSCRTLPESEIRADMRALDATTALAGSSAGALEIYGRSADEVREARTTFIRGVIARCEYEAVVLPDPAYAATLYANEPASPAAREAYYLNGGLRSRRAAGTGHIPPELRPLAALWQLAQRGFIMVGHDTAIEAASERVRPFIAGVMARHCGSAPDAMLDVVRRIMKGRLT